MNVWLTVTNRFLEKRESNKQLINFLEIWHSWHEVMLNYVFSNYSILFYKMREQCLQLFLIMLLPVLYYEGLIHQTKNFICIHSSLFFFVPQERKAALIWKIWKYEKHWQSWQINIYCAARQEEQAMFGCWRMTVLSKLRPAFWGLQCDTTRCHEGTAALLHVLHSN